MNPETPESRLDRLTAEALDKAARLDAELARRRGRPAEPGDLFHLSRTAAFPIEWALLDRDPKTPGRLLAVPADSNPLLGSADVEVPDSALSGPLSLRCRFGAWLEPPALADGKRTGLLETEFLEQARNHQAALERGENPAPLLAFETDVDPEYEDWVNEVLAPARAALTAPAAEERAPAPVVPLRPRWTSLGNPYALAASILLLVTLSLAGGLLRQSQRLQDLAAERTRTEEQLRQEKEKLAGELQQAGEKHRQELAERERQAEEARRKDQERIADLEKQLESGGRVRPLINVPFVNLIPRDPVRGEIQPVSLPPEADRLFLLLSIIDPRSFPSYRLELLQKDDGRKIWREEGLTASDLNEISLALPRSLFSPGDYRFRLFGLRDGKPERVAEYDLRIEAE
ncbi:MAG TPA: hypothetical protein VJ725_16615 [Thermoanaerobaculia bacterium]|nr:hypothetical protein [Thermoanaerobaculia bacterium]